VLLLASTWIVVGVSLAGAGSAVVSAGRSGFTVLGLLALSAWAGSRRPASAPASASTPAPPRLRPWQIVVLAGSGVTLYTICSTVAIALAGPVLPALVIALTPAAVLLAESVMDRVLPPPVAVLGTVVAIVGALLFVIPRLDGSSGPDVVLGTLAAVVAMGATAFYGIAFARMNRAYRGPLATRLLPVFALGAAPLVLWAAVSVATGATLTWTTVGLLAVLGIVIYVPVYLLQHRILLTAGASYTALLGLGVPPLVGVVSALTGLAAVPVPLQVVGIVSTVVGMGIVIGGTLRRAA
jgi:drug/metabolite transporter (DMT)-like permease